MAITEVSLSFGTVWLQSSNSQVLYTFSLKSNVYQKRDFLSIKMAKHFPVSSKQCLGSLAPASSKAFIMFISRSLIKCKAFNCFEIPVLFNKRITQAQKHRSCLLFIES